MKPIGTCDPRHTNTHCYMSEQKGHSTVREKGIKANFSASAGAGETENFKE